MEFLNSKTPLAQTLYMHSTGFTGTSNKNRVDLPDTFQGSYRLCDGEVIAYRSGHLMALTWRAEKIPVQYRRLLIDSLAASYIITAPPHPCSGRPRKRVHPESHDPERLNNRLYTFSKKTSTQRDGIDLIAKLENTLANDVI